MKILRVGVIGTGIMGENHVRVYSSLPNHCQLIGVFDTDEQRASQIAEKYKTNAFPSLEALLKKVDAVSVAVPTEAHYKVGLTCIKNHVHLLMEKPIANTVTLAKQLIQEAKKNKVKLQVGHVELYNPAVNVIRNILDEEEIVAVEFHRMSPFEARWTKVDVVNDLMIHDIYILFSLIGSKIDKIYSIGDVDQDHGVVRHAMALMRLKNGVNVHLTASFITEEKIRTIQIVTRKAFVQADLLDKKIIINRTTNFFMKKLNSHYSQQSVVEKVMVPIYEPLKLELVDFIDCIEKNKEPKISGKDGLLAIEVTNKINRSIMGRYEKDQS